MYLRIDTMNILEQTKNANEELIQDAITLLSGVPKERFQELAIALTEMLENYTIVPKPLYAEKDIVEVRSYYDKGVRHRIATVFYNHTESKTVYKLLNLRGAVMRSYAEDDVKLLKKGKK